MTSHRVSCGSRHSQGFSLIELMVSLVIGLIISVAAFSTFLGASGAAKIADVQARMNEDAQAALTILTQQLRMAGYNPPQSHRTYDSDPTRSRVRNPVYEPIPPDTTFTPSSFEPSYFAIRGCGGNFSNITTATSLNNLTCPSGTSNQPNSIAISYEADRFNTATNSSPTDCLGNALNTVNAEFKAILTVPTVAASTVTFTEADNRFYIGTSKGIISPSLYCQGNGNDKDGNASSAQPLVENIEDMRFTYGAVRSTTAAAGLKTAVVAGYLTADELSTQVNMASLPNDAERWAKVITVRICVLVRSERPVVSDANSAKYLNCEGTLVNASDLRLRRAYTTMVVLKNRRL